jgi:hypothetical protein
MLCRIGLSIALCVAWSIAGVSDYLAKENTAVGAKCADVIIVRPDLDSNNVNASLEPKERADAANALAAAAATRYNNYRIISQEQSKEIDSCNSKVVAILLQEYHTRPERMGQKSGAITIKILYFDSARAKEQSWHADI